MRIISGSAKGMKLFCPKGTKTRPMNDRIKESLFNIIASEVEEARVLDLFAGTGSLGLEALSRGADTCHFVERGREALDCLRKNIVKAHLEEYSYVIGRDAFEVFREIREMRFDLCFFDPPYRFFDDRGSRASCMEFLERLAVDHIDGSIILHYRKKAMDGCKINSPLEEVDRRRYGSTELLILEPMIQNPQN